MNTFNSSKKITRKKPNKDILLSRSVWYKRGVKAIWIGLLCIVLGLPLYVLAVSGDLFGMFGGMPSLRSIENPENDLS